MAGANSFQELGAWQDARELVKLVYAACSGTRLGREFALRDQVTRSAVSVMANIAEGHGRRGDQEFIQFLKVARGSCSETLSHMYVAIDMGMIDQEAFSKIEAQANKTGNKISALIRYLRSTVKEERPDYLDINPS